MRIYNRRSADLNTVVYFSGSCESLISNIVELINRL